MKRSITFLFFVFLILVGRAQERTLVIGKIVDAKGQGLAAVNIKTLETNQYVTSSANGGFKLILNQNEQATITLEFTYIGYQKLTKTIKPTTSQIDLGTLALKELNLNLEGIEINAKRDYQGSSNSSLIIGRDLIEQVPALSLNDLLNQIPNKKMAAPSLQQVQSVTLRGSFSAVGNGRNIYEMNNSFGVAIIVDGNTITNNLNMQSFNPSINGTGSNGVKTTINVDGYSLNGSPTSTSYSGDFAFGGTDLRQIPADQIESIEVIAGVPSAKYGDLSDGAIIVERQAGKAPAYVRMQLRDNATSYGFSKGFGLGKHLGALNVNVNYVNSFADNRDKLKAYKRLTLGTMHTNYYGLKKRIKNTFSLDYGRNLDGVRRDADDPRGKMAKFNSWNFSASNRTSFNIESNFLKNISLNLRYASGHQVSYTEEFSNEPYILVSDATTSGIHEGTYAKGIFTAQSLIDGRPLSISGKLDFNSEFATGAVTHFLSYGASYSHGANNGLGQVIDPSRPRNFISVSGSSSLSTNRSERYYDFNLAVAQQDFGFYVEDVFKIKLFERALNFRAGVRYDIQNNLPSFAPRINMNYELSPAVRLGLAYGLSYKSPALGQRYPGPSYFEIPVINAYASNGKAAESIYLVYVNRYDPSAKDLKSAYGETFEFSSQIKLKKYQLSLNVFHKNFANGFGNLRVDQVVTLPIYSATFRPNQQPLLTQTGTRKVMTNYTQFGNNLASTNQGFDVILTTPEIKPIATSFNISGGLFVTKNKSENLVYRTFTATAVNPDYAILGLYPANHATTYLSTGRISSTTHIPKISLFIQATAEFDLMRKTVNQRNSGTPLAYYNQNYDYITITNTNTTDPNYGHLFISASEMNESNLPVIVPNFHLSIGKEIKKRFKFSFNVYNVFNYQPYYLDSTGSYRYPNSPPTFGAEISLKL